MNDPHISFEYFKRKLFIQPNEEDLEPGEHLKTFDDDDVTLDPKRLAS